MARNVALITGVTGQDGAYLTEFLLNKGYAVHGVKRPASAFRPIDDVPGFRDPRVEGTGFTMHVGDITDTDQLTRLVETVRPAEIYNLAAQSHVHVSFDQPEAMADATAMGALRILEVLRKLGLGDSVRFYQASTREIFGNPDRPTQNEETPFRPTSPYGVAKLFGHRLTASYREAHGFHASCGIMFNHESPLRPATFVTRKVTRAAALHAAGAGEVLRLGNLDAGRDWGHARDFVPAMWAMLQQPEGDDYVIATGVTHTVRDLVARAFAAVGVEVGWRGQGIDEEGVDVADGRVLIAVDPRFFRPSEIHTVHGDFTKANRRLGWSPKVGFDELVREMVAADRARIVGGAAP